MNGTQPSRTSQPAQPGACGAATSALSLGTPSSPLPATLYPDALDGGGLTVSLLYTAPDAGPASDTLVAAYTTVGGQPATVAAPVGGSPVEF